MKGEPVYVFDAVRTPRGLAKDTGALHGTKPVELVKQLLVALAARTKLDPAAVEDVVLGVSTQVGDQGANVARTAVLYAGWPDTVPGMTVGRWCASGLDAIATAATKVASGLAGLVVAGGVESMSRVGILADQGAWFSDPAVAKATRFVPLGVAADLVATLDGRTREELDAVAVRSHARAAAATREGRFARSLVPVRGPDGAVVLDRDEAIREGITAEKLAKLAPAFAELGAAFGDRVATKRYPEIGAVNHLHTVGTSPGMADAASLVLVGSLAAGAAHGLTPRARLAGYASVARDPVEMLGAPAPATRAALAQAGRTPAELDVVEMNESFAASVLRFERELELDPARVNPNGGAIAMGHPLGATGGLLVATLLDELDRQGAALGAVAIPAGAGLASALVLARS